LYGIKERLAWGVILGVVENTLDYYRKNQPISRGSPIGQCLIYEGRACHQQVGENTHTKSLIF